MGEKVLCLLVKESGQTFQRWFQTTTETGDVGGGWWDTLVNV